MKLTDVGGGCNFEVITFDYIYPFVLKNILLSICKHLEKFTILTDQIIHTLKNEFVCFCM